MFGERSYLRSLNTTYEVGQETIRERLNNGTMWFRSFIKYYFYYHINVDYMSGTFSSHKRYGNGIKLLDRKSEKEETAWRILA